ncbi:MAG TPA: sigma-70 family RNA polymerase sigma factor [Gemmataceae bacterium]|nr:sigma-70 family RNA polymerase sigma factor [Gemmataceae bacterium]
MAADSTQQLQSIVERVRAGDPTARRALLDAAFQRLRRLTAHIFSSSFPALAARHEADSIAHEAWLRLAQAMETVDVQSVDHFFRLAAQKVRHVLLDLIEKDKRGSLQTAALGSEDGALGGRTYDPVRLAVWTEFHQKAAALPDDERAVFEMHYYLELPQAEIASLLGLHPRKVSRLWVSAMDALAGVAASEG